MYDLFPRLQERQQIRGNALSMALAVADRCYVLNRGQVAVVSLWILGIVRCARARRTELIHHGRAV